MNRILLNERDYKFKEISSWKLEMDRFVMEVGDPFSFGMTLHSTHLVASFSLSLGLFNISQIKIISTRTNVQFPRRIKRNTLLTDQVCLKLHRISVDQTNQFISIRLEYHMEIKTDTSFQQIVVRWVFSKHLKSIWDVWFCAIDGRTSWLWTTISRGTNPRKEFSDGSW